MPLMSKQVSLPKISLILQKLKIGAKSDMHRPFLHESQPLTVFKRKNKQNKHRMLKFACDGEATQKLDSSQVYLVYSRANPNSSKHNEIMVYCHKIPLL